MNAEQLRASIRELAAAAQQSAGQHYGQDDGGLWDMAASLMQVADAPRADRSGCTAGTDEECKHRQCATQCPKRAQTGQGVPVAWGRWEAVGLGDEPMRLIVKERAPTDHEKRIANWFRLYTHPAPQQKPLTDEQIDRLLPEIVNGGFTVITYGRAVARAIEGAHGIGEKK